MPEHLQYLVMAAIVGSGLMSGLLFAFSVVVMQALLQLAPATGAAAMQRINIVIVNPVFLLVFLGTAALCVAVGVVGLRSLPSTGGALLLAGAAAYLVGPLGITVLFNIPLNNQLASSTPEQSAALWPRYVRAWLRWNHVRTALGTLATGLLAAGLASAVRGL